MKIVTRIAVTGLVATVVLSAIGVTSVSAQVSLTNEQIDRIKTNCVSIKNTLDQLHASDALLRVNRGQLYEAIGTRLINNFNTRLSNNNQDTRGLQVVSNSYQTALNNFRNNYRLYEQQLSTAIRIDCNTQPSDFHYAIAEARVRREKVHEDVLKLNRYIDDYRSAVNDFLINYKRTTGDGS